MSVTLASINPPYSYVLQGAKYIADHLLATYGVDSISILVDEGGKKVDLIDTVMLIVMLLVYRRI